MSTVSELFPAGGGDNTIDMVASGTLASGDRVILNSDGTVEVVAGSSTTVAESIPAGAVAVYNSANTYYSSIAFDPNTANKFVVAYQDSSDSNYGKAVVGTVSGTSISFGSEYQFDNNGVEFVTVAFDPNAANKFVVTYKLDPAGYGTAIVGTVSGTTISYGSAVTFHSANTNYARMAFFPGAGGKFIVSYTDAGNWNGQASVVGTISGTSLSFGSEATLFSDTSSYTSVACDPNNDGAFLFSYYYSGGGKFEVCSGTVTGTTISFGARVDVGTGPSREGSIAFDPSTNTSFVIGFKDYNNGSYGTSVAGTLSGGTTTLGTPVVFRSSVIYTPSAAFNPAEAGDFVVAFRDGSNSYYGSLVQGSVSGTTVTHSTISVFSSSSARELSVGFNPASAGQLVVAFSKWDTPKDGRAYVCQLSATTASTNLTTDNLLGIAQEAATDGATVSIETLGGLSAVHSGLTIGSDYYVDSTGALTTTATDNVSLGKAVSATTINMRDYV